MGKAGSSGESTIDTLASTDEGEIYSYALTSKLELVLWDEYRHTSIRVSCAKTHARLSCLYIM